MTTYVIEPLGGVGPVRLGMARDEARRVMPTPAQRFRKTPLSEHETDAFHQKAFQVFYSGPCPAVEFIEVSRCRHLEVRFHDLSVFDTPADELLSLLARFHALTSDASDGLCSVIFPDIETSLWRPYVQDCPEEENGRYFSTIGIGTRGYYTKEA